MSTAKSAATAVVAAVLVAAAVAGRGRGGGRGDSATSPIYFGVSAPLSGPLAEYGGTTSGGSGWSWMRPMAPAA
jgi:hypothetical protein